MKTVTICGSMRFSSEMKRIAFELESSRGYNVLQCAYNELNLEITPSMRENLERAHLKKIDQSDGIYVVDIGGYTGNSVRREIAYARSCGKEILLHSEAADQ